MSEWIEWNGEDYCPVDCDAQLNIKFRQLNGEEEKDIYIAGDMRWKHLLLAGDIIAYRLADCALTNNGSKVDMVNSPSHYALLPGVEVIDVRDALFAKMPTDVPYDVVDCWSRSWEYLTRMWGKNGLEDAKKARFYLDRMIEKMERTE